MGQSLRLTPRPHQQCQPQPERALIARLVLVSLRDALRTPRSLRQAARRRKARRWLASDDTAAFSFRWCCDYLDLDPARARAAIASRPANLPTLLSMRPNRRQPGR